MDSDSRELTAQTPTGQRLPLSFAQEQLWFLDQFAPGEPTYNVAVVHRLHGPLEIDVLERSLAALIARHEMLRVTFGAVDGTPFQQIVPPPDVALVRTDLTGVPESEREQAYEDALGQETDTAFNLETGPVARFRLFEMAPDDNVLCITVNHIATDGWSMGVLYRELSVMFRALADGQGALPQPQLRYADYVTWLRNRLAGNGLEEQLQYWERQLAQLPALDLPLDRARPATPSFKGDGLTVELPGRLLTGLRELGQDLGASLFMLLAAGVNTVFARYTGQEDIPLGVTMLGRTEPEFEDVFGMFINMVVLRTDLSGDPSFTELVERTTDTCLDAYENQDAPFEKVVERLQPVHDPSRNPLFQVSLQLLGDGNSGKTLEFPRVTVEQVNPTTSRSRFDMSLNFVESGDRLELDIEYSSDLFDRWRVEALAKHVENVLTAVVADPSLRVSQVRMLAEAERDQLLTAGRGEPLAYTDDPMHVIVARAAAADPDAVAAVCERRQLTYGELDQRATQLARYLRAHGVQREQVVAIAIERSLDALVALLGTMKAGAAFTVLDVKSPPNRLAFMLKDTGAPVLLTHSTLVDRLPEAGSWEVVRLDTDWDLVASIPADEPFAEWATSDALAYVLYTSGSSGKPKGVLIEHRALISFVESYRRSLDLRADDRMLQLPALSFDMSQGEIFTALSVGATLVLVPPDVGSSREALADLMRQERVSYVGMSPAMLSLLDAEPYPDLCKIMAGGEAVPGEIVNKWNLPGRRLINCYGPTEAAVGCTAYECEHVVWQASPPIGGPFCDRRLYVVDRAGKLVPKGIPGELLIGGEEGLARGYLNQPELTAERFVPDPFDQSGRVYRTGDLVRWTPDWQLEFLGRLDNQVKLHGLRIELEEIESALLTHPLVGMAAVAVQTDSQGDRKLVGYVVPSNGQEPSAAELRGHLGEQLPAYMVPSAWLVLDHLPLTTARKVDRSALPRVDQPSIDDELELVAPCTPTEARVTEIFAEILSLPRVAPAAHFFELGGSSLQAMRALSRLNQTFAIKLKIRTLYQAATVHAVAAAIDELLHEKSRSATAGEPLDLLSRIEQMSEEEAAALLAVNGNLGELHRER
jgi:amino acid adenylation domain-containing protein